jgi:hypothetical protein
MAPSSRLAPPRPHSSLRGPRAHVLTEALSSEPLSQAEPLPSSRSEPDTSPRRLFPYQPSTARVAITSLPATAGRAHARHQPCSDLTAPSLSSAPSRPQLA